MKNLTIQNINFSIARQLATAGLMLSLASAWAQTPVKIGFLAELSGPTAGVGQDQLDGFNLVVERNGGKLGGVPVTLIKEDSQLKPDVANQAVRRLIEKENVSIVTGVSFSNIMMAVHKYVTDKEVFLIGSNAGPSQIAGTQCSPFQFITSWQGDQAAEAVGQYAKDKGYKKVFVLAPNYQAGKDIVTGFKRSTKVRLPTRFTPRSRRWTFLQNSPRSLPPNLMPCLLSSRVAWALPLPNNMLRLACRKVFPCCLHLSLMPCLFQPLETLLLA
jgi:hypothetical protein